MHATLRRYDGIDPTRSEEIGRKVHETLIPKLSGIEGFQGYYLIDSGSGNMTSVGFFDRESQSEESARLVADWVREEHFESAMPNPPSITLGRVVDHKDPAPFPLAAAI